MTNKIWAILRVLISVILLAVILLSMRGDYPKVFGVLKSVRLDGLLMGIGSFLVAVVFASQRLKLLIQAKNLDITFFESINLTFIGYFFNNFLPTSIGGDIVKAYYVAKKTEDKTASFASVFMDRFLGLFTMVIMACLATLFIKGLGEDILLTRMVLAMTAVFILALFVLFSKRASSKISFLLKLVGPFEERFKRLYSILYSYKKERRIIFYTLVLSCISQMAYFMSWFAIGASIGANVSFYEFILRIPLVSVLSLIPSINGLGVREGSFVFLFGSLIGRESAFTISLIMLFVLMCASFLGGVIYLISPQFRVKISH